MLGDKNQRLLLGLLTVCAGALRFLVAAGKHQPIFPGGDAQSYLRMADWICGRPDGLFTVLHAPGYAFFLCGTYVALGKPLLFTLFVQAGVGALTVPLAFRLANRLGGPAAGFYAVLWTALDPFQIYFSSYFLTETLFTTLLLAVLVLFLELAKNASLYKAILTGSLFGLATIVRGVLLPYIGAFAAYFLWRQPRRWPLAALMTGLALLPVAAWAFVAHSQIGHWVIVEVHKGRIVYEGLNEEIGDAKAQEEWIARLVQEEASQSDGDKVRWDDLLWKRSLDRIRQDPAAVLALMLRKIPKLWRLMPYREYYGAAARWISFAYMAPLVLFAALGALGMIRERATRETGLLLVGFIATYTLMMCFFWVQVRYRIPLHPLLAVLAGHALARFAQRPWRAA
jgi:4-amino-4-deoxy-L-arabinose transferase-like glycosyltransferase